MAAAAIILADELSCKWIFRGSEQPLTIGEISEFLASRADVSTGDRGYKFLCDWVTQNSNKLCGKSDTVDVLGAVEDGKAYIIRSVFERILQDEGYSTAAMAKAFALLCRELDDFAGLAPCQVRQIDWPECNGESEQCGDRPIWQCWQKYILERVDTEQVCRICGCTDNNACPGGCYWAKPDLCSACAEQDGPQKAGKGEADEQTCAKK